MDCWRQSDRARTQMGVRLGEVAVLHQCYLNTSFTAAKPCLSKSPLNAIFPRTCRFTSHSVAYLEIVNFAAKQPTATAEAADAENELAPTPRCSGMWVLAKRSSPDGAAHSAGLTKCGCGASACNPASTAFLWRSLGRTYPCGAVFCLSVFVFFLSPSLTRFPFVRLVCESFSSATWQWKQQ